MPKLIQSWRGFIKREYFTNIAWAIRCTYHPTLEAMPGQLVFGRDMILDIPYVANWNKITSDKVLITYDSIRRKLTPCREGPFEIIQ
eukprot:9414685-Ditylum_brightwellii.AAC.1